MSELNEKLATAWEGFAKVTGRDMKSTSVTLFRNYTPYEGDESFPGWRD